MRSHSTPRAGAEITRLFEMVVLAISVICFLSSVFAASPSENATSKDSNWIAQPHIVGGEPAKDPISYQVSLRYQKVKGSLLPHSLEHYCGGAFIRTDIVLTAAHCLDGELKEIFRQGRIYAVAGTKLLHYDPRTTFISNAALALVHPEHENTPHARDIAILRLREPFSRDNVGSIDLRSLPVAPGRLCNISGWGTLQFGKTEPPSEILRIASVPVVARSECEESYDTIHSGFMVTDDMMCAGYDAGGVDTCQGDSGGPLVCDGELAGVVSWGYGCGTPHIPGVYADVTWFEKWIQRSCAELQRTSLPDKPSNATRSNVNQLMFAPLLTWLLKRVSTI